MNLLVSHSVLVLHRSHNMVFTQGRGFVLGASFGLLIHSRSVVAFWFATPRTPPLWQRDFFLVNCFMLRSLSASERSGVVKTFR